MEKTIYWAANQRTCFQAFTSKDEAMIEARYLKAKIKESEQGRQTNDKASYRHQWNAKLAAIRDSYGWTE
jgi:hypothetical protein